MAETEYTGPFAEFAKKIAERRQAKKTATTANKTFSGSLGLETAEIGPASRGLLDFLGPQYKTEIAEQKEERKAGLGEMAEAAGLFGPGYGAGMEKAALTGAKQSLIGRGLGGTTQPMAVGAGMKAQFEDLRRGKLATALQQMAEYRRLFPTGVVSPELLANVAMGGYSTRVNRPSEQQGASNLGNIFTSGLVGAAGGALGESLAGGVSDIFGNLFGGNKVPGIDFSL